MTIREQQNKKWEELCLDSKCWTYNHCQKYWKYKVSRSPLKTFLDWLFGSPYTLEELMIKEYGTHNIINFNMSVIEQQNKNWEEMGPEYQRDYRRHYAEWVKQAPNNIGIKLAVEMYEEKFGKHNLSPAPAITYDDIIQEVLPEDRVGTTSVELPTFSYQHADKLVAINMLIVTAKFFNKNDDGTDWVADFSDENNEFYTLGIDPDDDSIRIIDINMQRVPTEIVYFRTKEIVYQVIDILGPDVIRTALSVKI